MADLRAFVIERSIPVPDSGCWIWLGAWGFKGYGTTKAGGQNYAHRLSYRAFVGPIPAGMLVCHKCDTRPCCNPDHLFLGTPADNIADASAKRRMHEGLRNYNAKLTPETVRAIRESKLSGREWARRLGISHATIRSARRGDTWRE